MQEEEGRERGREYSPAYKKREGCPVVRKVRLSLSPSSRHSFRPDHLILAVRGPSMGQGHSLPIARLLTPALSW